MSYVDDNNKSQYDLINTDMKYFIAINEKQTRDDKCKKAQKVYII